MRARYYLGIMADIVELLLAFIIEPLWVVFVSLIEKQGSLQEVKDRRCK